MKSLLISFFLIFMIVITANGQNHPPVAVNDTVAGFPGYDIVFYPLLNDWDPDQDSLIFANSGSFTQLNDSAWIINADAIENITPYDSLFELKYYLADEHYSTTIGKVIIKIKSAAKFDFIDINQLKALISPFGNHFWDLAEARFEAPKGTGVNSCFSHNLWIGGLSPEGYLHLAGEKYRQRGNDFYIGPISTVYDSNYMKTWCRLWKLNRAQIVYHEEHWSDPGYIPVEAILNWPAHGDVSLGQTASLAPFHDSNSNGIYEPLLGDYPLIRGDQAIFFVFNDVNNPHSESDGEPLGVEIHGMAYAYDSPSDSTLKNTLFFHYDILNKSAVEYQNTYLGLFNSFNLGDFNDDYVGCDVEKGMFYSYNSDDYDGSGNSGYGTHPPALGVKLIGGPLLVSDGIDNPKGNCDAGFNGLNFGDGVADNERMGLNSFITGWLEFEFGLSAPSYYQIMTAKMTDNSPYMYGGKLIESAYFTYFVSGGSGPACRYLYPGNSDTICNYGTEGIMPNDGLNQNGNYWTEASSPNDPGIREGVGAVGPFTFSPGQMVALDYCYNWARAYNGNNLNSVDVLRARVTQTDAQWNEWIRLPDSVVSVPENISSLKLNVYPNPSKGFIKVISPFEYSTDYILYDLSGKPVLTGCLLKGVNNLDISGLASGFYIIKCAASVARIQKI